MNLPPARRPVRWEDLTDCLAWPLLLRLPGLSLRWSRLLVGYVAAIPMLAFLIWPLELWSALGKALQPRVAAVPMGNFHGMVPQTVPDRTVQGVLDRFTSELAALEGRQIALEVLAMLCLLAWFGLAATMLARSTALEVARGLEVSPRAGIGWTLRHWGSAVLWLWPLPVLTVLAIVPALPVMLTAWIGPPRSVGLVLMAISGLLAFVWLLLAIASIGSAPLVPAATACDDGDDFDAVQRTVAITMSKPVRLVLCYAWIVLVASVMMSIVAWLVFRVDGLLSLGGERVGGYVWPALVPILLLVPAVGTSVIGSGITLAYLYLRRIADEQNFSEVPVRG